MASFLNSLAIGITWNWIYSTVTPQILVIGTFSKVKTTTTTWVLYTVFDTRMARLEYSVLFTALVYFISLKNMVTVY